MSTKLAKGTSIISLNDGRKLGTIQHIYFDPEHKAVVGFSFSQGGGLFCNKTTGLVDVTDVHAFGPDVVTIDDASSVHSELAARGLDNLIDLEDLLKRKVVTAGGEILGQVAAIHFHQDSYRLTALDVSPGLLQQNTTVPGGDVNHIGDELIIVADPVSGVAAERVLAPAG